MDTNAEEQVQQQLPVQQEPTVTRSVIAPGKRAPNDLRVLSLTAMYCELNWSHLRNFMADGCLPPHRSLGTAYGAMVPELAKHVLRATFGWTEKTVEEECQKFAAAYNGGEGVTFYETEPEEHSEERKHELLSVATCTADNSVMEYEKKKWGEGCKKCVHIVCAASIVCVV